jgi:membrane protease YdiL (CAAX protease family)
MTVLAWLFPLPVGLLAYGLAWIWGLAQWRTAGVPGVPPLSDPLWAFLLLVTVRLVIGVPIAAIAAAGEEIGWRGYMLTRLIELGVPRPILVSGLIWGIWHVPLILAGVYAAGPHPLLAAVMFVVVIVAQAHVLARVRLASGSVWPAVVGHSAWNATIQGVFDYSTVPDSSAWVGESGVLVAVAAVLVAAGLMRGSWPRLRAPGVPLGLPPRQVEATR